MKSLWNRSTRMACALVCFFAATSALSQIPGSLDTAGFATPAGKVGAISIVGNTDRPNAVAIQPDRKIVLAGDCSTSDGNFYDFCLARLNRDGSLDTSFVGPNGDGAGKFRFGVAGSDGVSSLLVQPDGRIVVAGSCFSARSYLCIARLNADGSFESSFDGPDATGTGVGSGNGRFRVPIGASEDSGSAIALQPDGKIVIAGGCRGVSSSTVIDFCVARLNADGSFDSSFVGPSGTGAGRFLFPMAAFGDDVANAVAVQSDGKILLAGTCGINAGTKSFCVARLNANGAFDTSFDGPDASGSGVGAGDGKVLIAIGAGDSDAKALLVQSDGKIVLGGHCTQLSGGAMERFCLVRLLGSNGALDQSFDGLSGSDNGKVILTQIASDSPRLAALALTRDEKIIIAGDHFEAGQSYNFLVARLTASGALDNSFGGPAGSASGLVSHAIGPNSDFANAVAVQPDGKIVVVGSCGTATNNDQFCVARLHGGPFACTLDFDGDGQILPTVDALIAARLIANVSGPTAIANINFTNHATRTTWPAMQGYFSAATLDIDGSGAPASFNDAVILLRASLGFTGDAVTTGLTFAQSATRTSWSQIRSYLVAQCGMSLAP
jgi:uncharacterized delta-60 repeat protein